MKTIRVLNFPYIACIFSLFLMANSLWADFIPSLQVRVNYINNSGVNIRPSIMLNNKEPNNFLSNYLRVVGKSKELDVKHKFSQIEDAKGVMLNLSIYDLTHKVNLGQLNIPLEALLKGSFQQEKALLNGISVKISVLDVNRAHAKKEKESESSKEPNLAGPAKLYLEMIFVENGSF